MATDWPTPRRRRGRRNNGLDAASFVRVRPVDPRVGEHLLDALRDARIAAYLEPVSTDDPYRLGDVPLSPPSDQLFVDALQIVTATEIIEHDDFVVGVNQPERFIMDSTEVDARFADLIARLNAPSDVPDHPAPPPSAPEDDALDDAEPLGPAADDPLDHYTPPEPSAVRAPSRSAVVASLVLALGVFLLFFPDTLGMGGNLSIVLGVFGITAGVGLLLLRLKDVTPEDEGEDGAVV